MAGLKFKMSKITILKKIKNDEFHLRAYFKIKTRGSASQGGTV